MTRRVPPPDFRYVSLLPGSASTAMAMAAGTVGLGAAGAALWGAGYEPLTFCLTLIGGLAGTFMMFRGNEQQAHFGARAVAMAIVPWGVLVEPDEEPRILRWPAIRQIGVHMTPTLRGGTPSIVATTVTVQTERELLAGRTPGAAELESLSANLDAYAEEASRPVARDLDGTEPCGDGATEPVMDDLLRAAGELCATSVGTERLGLSSGSYRTVASMIATPETTATLRRALASIDEPADPRPLAAILAALLGARDLIPDLVRLANAPHPVVAAVARAAALRLGAPRNRVGAIDEVAAFLFEEDFARIERWAEGGAAT